METGLTDLIGTLKRELEEVQEQPGKKLLFVETVEIEIKFVVEKAAEGSGAAKYLLFAVEGKGSYKSENVHTIKLTLHPLEGERILAEESSGEVSA